jgi:dTDP-4-dehydrorhamnose reductase
MKRVLITGSNGLLGQKLVELFSHCSSFSLTLASIEEASAFASTSLPYVKVDLTQKTDVRRVIDEYEPDIVINTAAMTNVDLCETNRELAWRTNVDAVENLIHACKLTGAQIVHFSTDYVFDGHNGPYAERDRPNPLSYYGRTKLASENLLATSDVPHSVIRTMVLYGVGNGVKINFALWLLKELSAERPIKVVDDQLGNPTLADDLAYAVLKIVELGRTGLYHIAGRDIVSRYDFALEFAEVFEFNKKLITPIKTSSLKQPAARPLKSGLITLKAETDLGIKLSGVVQGLRVFKNQLDVHLKSAADNEQE